MKKAIVATLMLLLFATWAIAQQTYRGQASKSSSSAHTTVQGCLGRTDGGYTLTDKSGNWYELTGETAQLNDHVGHEVQIKGTTVEPSTAPGNPAATTNQIQSRIDVSTVKHISETCNVKPRSETENPPMSEKPPIPPR